MYEAFYGLRERPFDLTPNQCYLLMTDTHREALSNLEYGINSRKGITLLIGEAGTGKTTLIRAAMARAESGGPETWAYLKNPTLSRTEFLQFLARSFQLSPEAAESKTRLLEELETMLLRGTRAALIVDEAQSVSREILEELRLLANIESETEKLLPLVLAGQPELAERLNERGLRQLKQRVALRCVLSPLSLRESARYVAARIEIAGGSPAEVFTRDAVLSIYEHSGGIPRTISVICDNALLTGYAEDQRPVGADVVEWVCRDFDLPRIRASEAAPTRVPQPAVSYPRDLPRPQRTESGLSSVIALSRAALKRRFS